VIQELQVWAQQEVVDSISEIPQRRDILDEEFDQGLLRQSTVSGNSYNSLMYLLTSYAKVNPFSPDVILDSKPIPDIAIEWVVGGGISSTETPQLFEHYGATFPSLPFTLESGWKVIVRKQ